MDGGCLWRPPLTNYQFDMLNKYQKNRKTQNKYVKMCKDSAVLPNQKKLPHPPEPSNGLLPCIIDAWCPCTRIDATILV